MILYDRETAPNPRKVRVYCAEKGIELTLRPVDMTAGENRSPEFLAMNPAGRVPVLELDDGTYITESLAIMEYLEELYPEPPLIGRTPEERAHIRAMERVVEIGLYMPTSTYCHHASAFFASRFDQKPDAAAYGLRMRERGMKLIESYLDGQEFVAGDQVSIADITLFITFEFGQNRGGLVVEDAYPNIQRWYAAFKERASARA